MVANHVNKAREAAKDARPQCFQAWDVVAVPSREPPLARVTGRKLRTMRFRPSALVRERIEKRPRYAPFHRRARRDARRLGRRRRRLAREASRPPAQNFGRFDEHGRRERHLDVGREALGVHGRGGDADDGPVSENLHFCITKVKGNALSGRTSLASTT